MKVAEIILEAVGVKAKDAAIKILTDCNPYLSQLGDPSYNKLYRGVRKRLPNFSFQPLPVNRTPLDTPLELHQICDDYFLKKFGIRFRSNATFACNDAIQSTEYGAAHILFPIGEFTICWSPDVSDLTYSKVGHLEMSYYYMTVADPLYPNSFPTQEFNKEAYAEDVIAVLEDSGYRTDGLQEAIKSKNEVMIHAPDGYYLVKSNVDDDDDRPGYYDDVSAYMTEISYNENK
jgi:hypothetical protein